RRNGLSGLWEFPLGLGSFLFYRSAKAVMRGLLHRHNAKTAQQVPKWQPVSGEFLSKPFALPLVMTTGPRWNTHAVIATLAPVVVEGTLEIDATAADRSARSWTVVVCTHPARTTVTSVGSLASPYSGGQARITLPAGTYWLGLRYYD